MDDHKTCFYCGALISFNKTAIGDHFPIPKRCGGTQTVPCCSVCHDMKDRFSIGKWPTEWISLVIADFNNNLSVATKLFLAKCISMCADQAIKNNQQLEISPECVEVQKRLKRRKYPQLDLKTIEPKKERQ